MAPGEDLPMGERTSFPQAVKLERNETAVFCLDPITGSFAERDRINAAAMQDATYRCGPRSMPFVGSR
jgi:uncharacterized protein YbaA (DUF1428 family)